MTRSGTPTDYVVYGTGYNHILYAYYPVPIVQSLNLERACFCNKPILSYCNFKENLFEIMNNSFRAKNIISVFKVLDCSNDYKQTIFQPWEW